MIKLLISLMIHYMVSIIVTTSRATYYITNTLAKYPMLCKLMVNWLNQAINTKYSLFLNRMQNICSVGNRTKVEVANYTKHGIRKAEIKV